MSEAAPDLPARLRAAGLRVTSQRLLLHATLVEIGRHATADEVMRAAVPRLPGLSLPTVSSKPATPTPLESTIA